MTAPGTADRQVRTAQLDAVFSEALALWARAGDALAVLCVAPQALGGLHVRSPASPARRALLDKLRDWSGTGAFVDLPAGVPEARLIGGLSLAKSIEAGRPVAEKGLLAGADLRIAQLHMAERCPPAVAAQLADALETGHVQIERSGVSLGYPARFCLVALDEGEGPGEAVAAGLRARLALHIDLTHVPARLSEPVWAYTREEIAQARAAYADVTAPDALVEAIVQAAAALAIPSLRAPVFCLRAARALAALNGRREVEAGDAEQACALVYGHLARPDRAPSDDPPPPTGEAAPPPSAEPGQRPEADGEPGELETGALDEQLIAAVRNAALLGALDSAQHSPATARARGEGRSGAQARGARKGRPDRPRPAQGRRQGSVDLTATLRAAAPWQKLRGRKGPGLVLRAGDLHIKRHRHRAESSVIFVIDASGSAALNRLGDVKGAIELLLSECYRRRDHVSLVSFRGERAELVLPPTRSLTRVRRGLIGLAAGGTTPLASALVTARAVVDQEVERGRTPLVVILSDGRGNVALEPGGSRGEADRDGERAAARLRQTGAACLFFDTSRRASPRARALSAQLGAAHRPMPASRASQTVAKAVRSAIGSA
ncbi:MAG: VWA domain-containing protein [Pseudomonadota bacterium]